MKNILVTGGAGYVGSHACKALAEAGYLPITYDNLERGHAWAVQWGPLEEGDILDRERLDAVIRQYQPDAVMHFAAYAYVGESVTAPEKYFRNNTTGSKTLLEAMRDHGIPFLVFSSTCATYGNPVHIPITEDHPQKPINPYGESKLQVEQKLQEFHDKDNIRYISLRYFNAAGADPDRKIGEAHEPETHLVPLVLQTALGMQPAIEIFGADYDTADGTCIRDYIHVSDLADAHVNALVHLQKNGSSQSLNLGTGKGNSVREIIAVARDVTGRDIPEKIADRRPGDPPVLIASAERATKLLDWQPQRSDIQEIIETAWHWHNRKGT